MNEKIHIENHWPSGSWDKVFLGGKAYWQLAESDVDGILSCFPGASTVLDMACGTGELAFQLASRGLQVDASDFSPAAIEKANEEKKKSGIFNVHFFVSDIEKDVLEKQYDIIFLKLAFAFIQDRKAFLERIKENFLQGLVIITPVIDSYESCTDEKMKNISVLRSEMDDSLKSYFGSYEILSEHNLSDGSKVQVFICKK